MHHRILNLQLKKQSLADAALGEGSGQKIRRMTVAELKAVSALFHWWFLLTTAFYSFSGCNTTRNQILVPPIRLLENFTRKVYNVSRISYKYKIK